MILLNVRNVGVDKYLVDSPRCPMCDSVSTIEIDGTMLYNYNRGGFVHEVLTHLDADQRESFVSGYCSECFDKMMEVF